jgi:hypothetical protein
MQIHYKYIIATVLIIIAFAAGRKSIKPEIKTVTVTQTIVQKHKNIETVTTKQPDGTVKIIKREVIDSTNSILKSQETVVKNANKTFNISALVSNNIHEPLKPIYGISINKETLGPVTIGAFGLTNGTVGLSLGINF